MTDDAEMMIYDCERNTLKPTPVSELQCFVDELQYWSTNWLQRRQVTNTTAKDSGSQGKSCSSTRCKQMSLRTRVSLGWRSRKDLLTAYLIQHR